MLSVNPLSNIFLKFLNNYDLGDEEKPNNLQGFKALESYTLGLVECPHGKSPCGLNEDETCPTLESDASAIFNQVTMKQQHNSNFYDYFIM